MADSEGKGPGGLRLHRGKRDTDEAVIAALVLGANQQDAAKHASVSVKTIERRLRTPGFQRKLAAARNEIVRQSVDRASSYGNMALGKLLRLMESRNDAIALGAARTLAEIAFKMREYGTFEERLAALETERGSGPELGMVV